MAYIDHSRYRIGVDFLDEAIPDIDESDVNLDTLVVYDNYMSMDGKGDWQDWSIQYWGRNFYDLDRVVVTDVDASTPYGDVYFRDADWHLGEIGTTDGSALIQDLTKGFDEIYGSEHNDKIVGGLKGDSIEGRGGNDFIHGQHGADLIEAGAGNDTVRGGHGPDFIDAGTGSDWVWGGVGRNQVYVDFKDGLEDQIFVPVDSVQNKFGNPNGANADELRGLGTEDKIFMHGVDDSALTYGDTNFYSEAIGNTSAVGIYANGTLEAYVFGLNAGEVSDMTTGGFFA